MIFASPANEFARLCGRFLGSKSGNVAITFGIAAVPLFGAVGAALDYSRIAKLQTTLQSAMDASVLAGLAAATGKEISTATNIFSANVSDAGAALGQPSYVLDATCGCLTGGVSGTVAMSI